MKEFNYIFKAIVGSQAYSTNTANSDIDFKGVYIQHPDDVLSFNYQEFEEKNKDESFWEVRRFLELCSVANPTAIELLFSPDSCIIEKKPQFDLILEHRDKFLTKKCFQSFGKYAEAQIRKAQGLDKKMNWEKNKIERKTPLDFCYIITPIGSRPLRDWLRYQKADGTKQHLCGVSVINHCKDLYFIYPSHGELGYHGIINEKETSNDLCLSSIPKEQTPNATVMFYGKDNYVRHCKDYKSYQEWLGNRNTQRYVDNVGHDQKIDSKNMAHCRRLLDVAIEIAKEGTINVRRPNADYLLKIRKGGVNLKTLMAEAEQDILGLDELYAKSNLPDDVDHEFVNELLIKVRNYK